MKNNDFSSGMLDLVIDNEVEQKEKQTKKKKTGRPKNEKPFTRTSIGIWDELYDYFDAAAVLDFGGNHSEYINSLVEKDVAKNKDYYSKLIELRNLKKK